MIHNKMELVHILKTSFFQMSKKLAIIEYVWNVRLRWNPKLEQSPYLQKLNQLSLKYQNYFNRDLKLTSSFDGEILFAEELEGIRKQLTLK